MSSEYKKEIDELQKENDQLAKTLGNTTIERDWAAGKQHTPQKRKRLREPVAGLDLSNKQKLIEFKPKEQTEQTEQTKFKLPSKARQCELIGVSRSSLYHKPKLMSEINHSILNAMDEIYTDNPEYGYRYIHQQLLENGVSIGKHGVLKYMKILGIKAIFPRAKKLTSIKEPEHKIYPYLLKEYKNKQCQVVVNKPNEVWSGDITYLRVNGGFMYLAAVIDWHSKAILSYKISNTMDLALAEDAPHGAIDKYGIPKIFNSDQGSQYTSRQHTQTLKDNKIQISMNGKGQSIDNIAIERFFYPHFVPEFRLTTT